MSQIVRAAARPQRERDEARELRGAAAVLGARARGAVATISRRVGSRATTSRGRALKQRTSVTPSAPA